MIDLKSAIAVFLLLAALLCASTDDFRMRCEAGDKEYCVK